MVAKGIDQLCALAGNTRVGISKQGDGHIRRLLVFGTSAVIRFARQGDRGKAWLVALKAR